MIPEGNPMHSFFATDFLWALALHFGFVYVSTFAFGVPSLTRCMV